MPAAGHLVHMPAHIYIRSGYYEKAMAALLNFPIVLAIYPVLNLAVLYKTLQSVRGTLCEIVEPIPQTSEHFAQK